jgi:DNA modification methylase
MRSGRARSKEANQLAATRRTRRTADGCLGYEALYRSPVCSTRGGPLFNAFPYPTKISPEAIALFIAAHTAPGATVLDGFAGSGSTGLAAILCGQPTDQMRQNAERLGLDVRWGARRAVLYELGVLGAFVAEVLCNPPDSAEFTEAAEQLLADVRGQWAWLYNAHDPDGGAGEIRYVVWSDLLRCPKCRKQISLWDACVSRRPANICGTFRCPHCGAEAAVDSMSRVRETVVDDFLGKERLTRRRVPVWVYGETKRKAWSRPVSAADLKKSNAREQTEFPEVVPLTKVPWGDLYRSGYHEGISHLHHFYTHRNLLAFSALWKATVRFPERLQPALRFWLLSYNAAHSTLMTRGVAKKDQNDLVVTSAQPGVLYISGLPVEKNIFAGVRRKIGTMQRAFALVQSHEKLVEVRNASSLQLDLRDASVDYVFTDPPFGGNIPYSEVNFINEAWLGQLTDATEEAIVSPHQKKAVDDYQELLRRAFQESHRVLRPDGCATVAFNSASAGVWNALRSACEDAGFHVAGTTVLDKTQASFKQVRTNGAVRGDPLILLSKTPALSKVREAEVWAVTKELVKKAAKSSDPAEDTPQRLYSRLVGYYVAAGQSVPIDAGDFYRGLQERHSNNAEQTV